MCWFWILIWAAFLRDACAYRIDRKELVHGNQMIIKLSTEGEKLEFLSPDEMEKYTIWSRNIQPIRGTISGLGENKRYVINSVTFDDEGTYKVLNYWGSASLMVKLKVLGKFYTRNCVPGEALSISLEGLLVKDASLRYTSNDTNILLVKQGTPLKDNLDYIDRIKVKSNSFTLINVNVSDLGNYSLYDQKGRRAAVVRLNLVDHHGGIDASPLMSLMLLLGLPVGICYCCRRRICRSSTSSTRTTAVTVLQQTEFIPPPGAPPPYNNPVAPMGPGPIYPPGYPAPGDGKVYPPPSPNPAVPPHPQCNVQPVMPPNPGFNPGYGPQNPVYPAVPTPQWPGSYNPCAPGSAPVMYNAPAGPEPGTGDIKLNEMSSATPLLPPSQPEIGQPPAPYISTDVLNSSATAVEFNINAGKSSTSNFL